MLKMHCGEHPDALYLKSSGQSATSLSHSASELHKRPMDTEEAEELVRQWENVKAEALGPTHQVYSLSEVLDESMLVQVTVSIHLLLFLYLIMLVYYS